MNISATFINRPVGTTLLTVGLALAGAIAFRGFHGQYRVHVEFGAAKKDFEFHLAKDAANEWVVRLGE